jgi:hypothetical protein
LSALLAACAGAPLGTATNTFAGDQAGIQQETLGDRDLAARFVLEGLKTEQRDGRLRVQFDLRNTTPGDLRIEWTIGWRDKNGFRISTSPYWHPTVVTGQGFEPIQALAPTPEAVAFQLLVRRPTAIR